MSNVNIDTIKETIKDLSKAEQEIILHLTEIFEGEEEVINEIMYTPTKLHFRTFSTDLIKISFARSAFPYSRPEHVIKNSSFSILFWTPQNCYYFHKKFSSKLYSLFFTSCTLPK